MDGKLSTDTVRLLNNYNWIKKLSNQALQLTAKGCATELTVGRKMNKVLKVAGFISIAGFLGLFSWFTYIGGTAYIYAGYLENKWIKENPKTKNQLEKHLSLYSIHEIKPQESMWGNKYQMKDNERMLQYRILWNRKCPLDVVYDSENNIKRIFTSYE